MFKTLVNARTSKARANRLYAAITERGRAPIFFAELGVPDTIDGRFDLLVLHAWMVLDRLRELGMKDVSQSLVDTLFVGFEDSLRDLGVGDIGIGHRVKKMANAFYGRLAAYDAADGKAALTEALVRNVYRGRRGDAETLATYAVSVREHLAARNLSAEEPDFGPLPQIASAP